MSSPQQERQQQKLLKIGTVLSKGEENLDSPFSFTEEGEDQNEPFEVSAESITTGRTCVIGCSGSGKSYTVGVICEELCKSHIPFVIIDIEGEYSGLKEKFEAVWIGDQKECDLIWNSKIDLKILGRYAPDCPPIIFDLSGASKPREKVNEFLTSLYREISRRRTPYLVILEEADRFSPQARESERLQIFDEIARRGRKRGIGLMLCTQRPSLVDKNILSQCSNQLIGRLVIKNDLNSVAQFFSGGPGTPSQLTALKPGEFFALGGLAVEPEKIKVRARESRHGGITPKLNPLSIRPSVETILESIQNGILIEQASPEMAPRLVQDHEEAPEPEVEQIVKQERNFEIEKIPESTVVQGLPKESEAEIVETPRPASLEDGQSDQSYAAVFDWENGRAPEVLGLAPLIQPESVPRLVKLEKSYKLFGQKENVLEVALAYRPILEIGVRIRTGVLKKKFETKYFFMDGVSGKLASITDRLDLRSGIERLLGLSEGQVQVLKVLLPEKDQSLIEISSLAKKEQEETRRLLRGLETKRLARVSKNGRTNMYRRLSDIPSIGLDPEPLLKLNELNDADGFRLAKQKIKEESVREVVKGLWSGADVESYRQIYYPVYLAQLSRNERKRYVWIDGRTGKEIEM